MVFKRKLYLSLAGLLFAAIAYGQTGVKKWTLEECINYAWQNNLSIRTNELNLRTNEINLKESKFARLPSLNGNGSVGKQFGRTINPNTNEFTSRDVLGGNMSLSSSVTLFRGGQLTNTIKRNELNLRASEYDLQKAKNDIGLSVATNFLNVLLNTEQLENARYQLQVSVDQLERTRKLVEAGSARLTAQLDLESQKATNEVNVVNAENNLSISLLNLKQAMQMSADQELDIVAPAIDVTDVSMKMQQPSDIFQVALNAQPEIKSADLGVESSDYGIKLAKAAFLPTVSLNGSISSNFSDQALRVIGFQDIAVPQIPIGVVQGSGAVVLSNPTSRDFLTEDVPFFDQVDNNLGQSVSLNLSIPIFNRFSSSAGLQRAQITKQRAEITAMNTRNTLRQNIESAYNSAVAGLKSYEATQKRVTALEETFRATEERYNVGDANFVEYQVASNNLFAARTDLVRSKYEYIFRVTILDFYLGNPITLD